MALSTDTFKTMDKPTPVDPNQAHLNKHTSCKRQNPLSRGSFRKFFEGGGWGGGGLQASLIPGWKSNKLLSLRGMLFSI